MRLNQIRSQGLAEQHTLQHLDEVRMNSGALKAWAGSAEAEGIQAGFEAELIFPGLSESDSGEWEPDYDTDTRTRSFADIIDFFSNSDSGNEISSRQADRLQDQLTEAYYEFIDEARDEAWDREGEDYVRDWVAENVPEDEWNPDELEGDEREEALAEFAANVYNDNNSYNSDARDAFNEEHDPDLDEDDYLRSAGLRYMSDVASEYDLGWPHWTGGDSEGGYNDAAAERLATDLKNTLGVKVKSASGYHSTKREPGLWIIEPDGSLDGDNSDDMPCEIISPPMPLNDCISAMTEFFAWAATHDAYSNNSTGFHMSVSLPYTGGSVDFVKLALFLGDEHVLKEFGRSANHFCQAAIGKVRNRVSNAKENTIADAMMLMKKNLIEFASRTLSVSDSGFGKYTSINPKGPYVEFRSAGGAGYFDDVDSLANFLRRYARAMKIAADPAAERKEYAKKLYKLIAPEGNNDLALFAKFSSGEISAQDLKNQWAEQTLKKDAPSTQRTGSWKFFDKRTGDALPGGEFHGFTEQGAWERAQDRFGWPSVADAQLHVEIQPMYHDPESTAPDKTSRRAQLAKRIKGMPEPGTRIQARAGEPEAIGQTPGNWGIWIRNENRFSRQPGQSDNSVLRRFPSREAAESFVAQLRSEHPTMRTDIEVCEIEPTRTDVRDINLFPEIQPLGEPPPPPANVGRELVGWNIVDGNNQVLHTISGIGNNQADANRHAIRWLTSNGYGHGTEVEVVPAWREA
jgi:hypothetical protein